MSFNLLRRTLSARATALNPSFSPLHFLSTVDSDDAAVTSAVGILRHHRNTTRWSTLRRHHPDGFSPLQFSQITLQIRNNPHLALRFFHFTNRHSLSSHSLLSYSTLIHILARGRLKFEAKTLIKDAILVFDSRDFDPFDQCGGKNHKSQAKTLIKDAIMVSESRDFDPFDQFGEENPKAHPKTLIKDAILPFESKDFDPFDQFGGKIPKIFEALVKTYRVCDSAPFVFDLLIKACLGLKRIDQSIEIVRLLRSRGIYPSISTCNDLISKVLRCKGCNFGYDLYREVLGFDDDENGDSLRVGSSARVCPNVHTFNELMLSFYRNELVGKVESVWIEMRRLKCEPDAYSYGILMAVYCDDGELDMALKVFEEMKIKGLESDSVAYNTLIGAYCRTGNVEGAEALYREMGLSNIQSTCVTYEHLVNGYCKAGDLDSAMLLLKDMKRKGFRPDSLTIDAVVVRLCDKNRVSEAFEFFRGAMENASFVARETTYAALIKGLSQEGKRKEALMLQVEMVGKGFEPDPHVYSMLFDSYMNQEGSRLDIEERLSQ